MTWRTVPASAVILATLLLVPATGWSAVARSGNTFYPKTGAELIEAAGIISATGQNDPLFQATVELVGETYAVSSPVVFTSLTAPIVTGPASGARAVVSNSGSPATLLRMTSRTVPTGGGVSNVDFTLKGTTSNSVVAVDLHRGSALRDSLVTVPSATPKATAVRLAPSSGSPSPASPAVLRRVRVQSNAPEAPAVTASNGAQILDSAITGGAPALNIAGDSSGSDLGNVTVDASTIKSTGSDTPVPVVRVRGGSVPVRAVLWSTVIDGTPTGATQLVDIDGPTVSSGAVNVELGQISLRGVGTASSTGISVRPGIGSAKLTVKARGLLAMGSLSAVDCQGSSTDAAAVTEVTIAGIWRSNPSIVGSKCLLSESGLRQGTLSWRNEAAGDLRPAWNSPLIDAVSNALLPAGVGSRDRSGEQRFVQVVGSAAATPGDIGALEYQLTPPENVAANFTTLGNRGLTALIGQGTDGDEGEEPRLVFRWTMPDGSSVTGQAALYRFGSAQPQQVTLAVVDVTGVTVRKTITITPNIRMNEPATDVNSTPVDPGPIDPGPEEPGPGPEPEEPEPEVPSGPSFVYIPPAVSIPTIPSFVSTQPPIDPLAKQDFPPILKSVTAKSRRVLTNRKLQPAYMSARKGEAEFVIHTWRESEMALEVSTVLEGAGLTVGLPVARYELRPFTGRKTLRIGAKIGGRKLKPGLYQMTIAATPRPGAVPERRSFFVRVVRAK